MRVTLISHLFPSPEEPLRGPFVAEQARSLSAYADVTAVCGVYGGEDSSAVYDGIPVRYLRLPWNEHLPSKVALASSAAIYARRVRAWLDTPRRRPDVVHAHYGFPDGVVGSAVARSMGVPCVVTLHGDDANIQMRLPVIGPLIASALGSAATVICVSETMRASLAETYPRLAPKLRAVPNGYDARDIGRGHREPADCLLFVGALLPVKNPDLLIRAYARVAPETPLRLDIAGEGPMRAELEALSRSLGVADRVRFLGRLAHSEVGSAMRRAHALVLPSRHEGMPIVVIEALASGTPVVASAVGGIPELVRDDGLGLLVEPDDENALVGAMRAAVSRGWSASAIAARAPVMTWDDNARIVAGIYEHALAGARVPMGAVEGIGD